MKQSRLFEIKRRLDSIKKNFDLIEALIESELFKGKTVDPYDPANLPDINRIGGSIPASERGKIMGVRDIIFKMDEEGTKEIPLTDIFSEALKLGIAKDKVDEAIEKLKRSGDIFQPKSGYVHRI